MHVCEGPYLLIHYNIHLCCLGAIARVTVAEKDEKCSTDWDALKLSQVEEPDCHNLQQGYFGIFGAIMLQKGALLILISIFSAYGWSNYGLRDARMVRLAPSLKAVPMTGPVITAVGTMLESGIVGGLLSGGLHAVSGPDHIAAVLPPSMGNSGFDGLRLGATWGLGHGISATMLGLAAIILKRQVSSRFHVLERLSSLADSAVGFSLLFIGLLGIKESRAMEDMDMSDGATARNAGGGLAYKAIFGNGLLHGLSLDGAPSIAPALAMKSWQSAVGFLVAYCFGTMATMSITAGAVGESSMRLFKSSKNPKMPRQLCMGSSIFALLAGMYWIARSLWV